MRDFFMILGMSTIYGIIMQAMKIKITSDVLSDPWPTVFVVATTVVFTIAGFAFIQLAKRKQKHVFCTSKLKSDDKSGSSL